MIFLSVSVSVSAGALAQNLDPTVVVSRDYEGKLIEVHKPKIEMAVPDSVLRFDLEFDYSVSESPYKGAYEFTPYALQMKPSPTFRPNGKMYLNAGVGYQFNDELDFVWSPALKSDSFRMNVYARHRSYMGKWWNIGALEDEGGLLFDRLAKDAESRDRSGKDLVTDAGFDGRYDWDGGVFRFQTGYYGLYQREGSSSGRSYNAFDIRAGVRSKEKPGTSLGYYAEMSYRHGGDCTLNEDAVLSENVLEVDASLFSTVGNGSRIRLDLGYDMAGYGGYFDAGASHLSFSPHYAMAFDWLDVDLGLTLSNVFRAKAQSGMYQDKVQVIYPDVRIGIRPVSSLLMYVDIGGGSRMNTYSSLLASDRHITMLYGRGQGLLDMTDERISAVFGLEGCFGKSFSYALKGGYSDYANAPLASIVRVAGGSAAEDVYLPALVYEGYGKTFVALNWRLDAERLDFDGALEYASCRSKAGETAGFMPPALSGDLSFRYNWKKRVYAGLGCGFSSARKGNVKTVQGETVTYIHSGIPGYADLSADLEYVINNKISVWAKGGNLLNMTIQRSLLYAEKGPCFTLGFCMNL